MKHKEWQEKYKCALFAYLLKFDYIDVYQPDCVRKATYDYLCENDDLTCWLDQHYEIVDSKYEVKLSAMCRNYKETYLKIGSRAYRQMTHQKFLELLKENLKYKSVVAERFDSKQKRLCFVGLKEKEDDSDDEY